MSATLAARSTVRTNSVLRNTFLLLSMTLAWSAAVAGVAIVTAAPMMNVWVMLGVYIALLFAVSATQESGLGIVFVFALTGWLGWTAGPIVGHYLAAGMADTVILALGSTAVIFIGLAGYATTTKKDFSYMIGFLTVGILTAFVLGIVAMLFNFPALSLAVSGAFVLLSSGLILWQISNIVNGGETNYISATVTLFVSIFNIFLNLLQLFSALGGDD